MNCLDCGYTFGGSAEHRCSECGREFDPTNDRTFDRGTRCLRSGMRCLWVAVACTVYALLLAGTMIGAVAARLADKLPVMESAHLVFSVAACGTPFVFILHGSVMIAAPLVAKHARPQLSLRWWLTLVAGVAVWCGAGFLFLFLLPALIL